MLRLLDISANIRTRLQDRLIEQKNRELDNSEETYQAPVERLDNQEQGRPRLAVNDLRRLGFSWTDIACMLTVFPPEHFVDAAMNLVDWYF